MPWSFVFPMSLVILPTEILCHILEYLEIHDLLTCSLVSKHIRRVMDQSSKIQYSIELQRARMVSLLPSSSSPPFASRLKLLRSRESNWRYINWAKRHTLSLPPTGSVYEFVGGLYGNGREDDSRVTASISFLELPSSDASFLNEPEQDLKAWTHSMGDINIIDFTMDPSQDLLVLVALAPQDSRHIYELHLRSIKTNKPHYKAPLHVLPCCLKNTTPVQTSDLVAAVRVQVCGNLIALLIKEIHEGPGAHLEIWNWETHPQFSCALTRNSGIDDFTFLTNDTFLLVRPAGRFEVYTFVDPSTCRRSTTPVLRVMYSFPRLSPGYMYWYISMSSNPAPGYVPRPRSDNYDAPEIGNKNQIYYPRPEERIHACCLYIFNPANEENARVYSFVFFLNLQSLLNPPTEWIDRTRGSSSSKSQTRSSQSTLIINTSAVPTQSAVASGSSSASPSPITSNAGTHDSPISFLESTGTLPPFIPPPYPEGENIRHSPQYPLFPTFDEHRSSSHTHGPTRHHVTRIPPLRKPFDSKTQSQQPSRPGSRRVRPATSSLASIPPNTEISWDVWGPSSTRWFEECLSTDWQHAIYGLRTVESINPNHGANRSVVIDTGENPPDASNAGQNASSSTNTTSGQSTSNGAGTIGAGPVPSSSAAPVPVQPSLQTSPAAADAGGSGQSAPPGSADGAGGSSAQSSHRHLRVRDFNPYSFTESAGADVVPLGWQGAKEWRAPRLVTGPSTTPVRGVFMKDIVSSLPYMEIVSKEKFDVTDVMMDDSRVLLLKRGQTGKLERVEVLMM